VNIDPHGPQRASTDRPPVAVPTSRARVPSGAPSGPAAGARLPGGVDLSPQAQDFLKIRPRLVEMPEIAREERIAHLRGLIDRGQYVVTGEQIAGALLRDEAVARLLGFPSTR
jgi:anti-sigma28 factor (negative regulator of flagellin synthesis)